MAGGGSCSSCCKALRAWLYIHYFAWWCLASASGLGIIWLCLAMVGVKSPTGWLSLLILAHWVVVTVVVGCFGRWWSSKNVAVGWMIKWKGGASLQTVGIGYAVVIGIVVTKADFKPWLPLLYTCYAFCISRFMLFPTRFDFTMAWICTTAGTAWVRELGWDKKYGENWCWALGISTFLTLMIFFGKYLDGYRPPTRDIYEEGRSARLGPAQRPDNADPFVAPPPEHGEENTNVGGDPDPPVAHGGDPRLQMQPLPDPTTVPSSSRQAVPDDQRASTSFTRTDDDILPDEGERSPFLSPSGGSRTDLL